MEEYLQTLREHGCDVDGALGRMLGDGDFLLRCARSALDMPEFEQLGSALAARDAAAAFEYAHALKGVTANVGLTPLYTQVTRLVEPLRAGRAEDLDGAYGDLLQLRKELRALLA